MCIRDRSIAGGSILNVTQDDLVSTNENVNESVSEIANEIEMVDDKSSKSNNVDILSQLALMMEIMNNKFDQQKDSIELKSEMNNISKINDNLNTSLNEFKTEMKSEDIKIMHEINASSA